MKSCVTSLKQGVFNTCERRTGVVPDDATGETHAGMNGPLGQHMRFITFEDPVFEPMLTNPVLTEMVRYTIGDDALLPAQLVARGTTT